MSSPRRIVVVIPARNEARMLGAVLSRIPSRIGAMTVKTVVVDDGSTDGTGDVARQKGVSVLRHLTNLGVGAATRTGFQAAERLGADVIVTLDADGQHDPADIERLLNCLIEEDLDIVIGSRLVNPAGMPAHRVAANLLMNGVTYIVYRQVVSDSQSGFKAISRNALRRMDLRSTRYEICSEIVGEIFSKRLRYRSVPVRAVYTEYSQAKGQHFLNGVNVILQLLNRMMRRV